MDNNGSIKYSVVIPVYASSRTLLQLVHRTTVALDKQKDPYEILLIEDDGPDDSWDVMKSLLPDFQQLRILKLNRNFGQHNALMCGFAHARGEYIITLDDDLQTPPEEIEKLTKKAKEGFDVVYGVPAQKHHHALRNIGSYLVRSAYKIIFKSDVFLTAFRIIHIDIIREILHYDKNFTYIDGLLAWHTTNIGEVEVKHEPRRTGCSGYSTGKLITLTLNMFTNFSILPLQFVFCLGLVFAGIGFLSALGYLTQYLIWGIPVPGYTSLIIGTTMFSGVQMLSLGLIGEYLGRIHLNINSKPQYFVRENLEHSTGEKSNHQREHKE